MKHKYLYLSISVSGASVLAIEILGTRVLGPFYGASLFLWSALITVTLAALSIGYFLGGRWADRGATYPRLSSLLAAAGIWLLVVPWIRTPLLRIGEAFGPRFAVLVAALVLFFLPLMLLGMASPYAIKLRAASLDEVGRAAGNLYAISTVASVAAALLTGFFLVPSFGVYRLTTAVGAILIVAALPGFFRKGRIATAVVMMALAMVAGGALISWQQEFAAEPERGLIFKAQSQYTEIRVVDDESTRYLLIDGGIHTMVDTSRAWQTLMPYANAIDIAQGFFEEPGRLLLVGLGGGSVAKSYSRAKWTVDAVEIDPVVVRVAHDYFRLDAGDARIFQMDGRRFLATSRDTYDVIVMDAFGSSSIPFHLVTREVFGLIASRLTTAGIVVVNVQAVGWEDLIVRSLTATLKTQFPHVWALPTMEPPNTFGNVLLFAARRPLELRTELPIPAYRFSAEYDRAHAWDNRFEPNTINVPILTDDRNPVDVWAEAINVADREELRENFAKNLLRW